MTTAKIRINNFTLFIQVFPSTAERLWLYSKYIQEISYRLTWLENEGWKSKTTRWGLGLAKPTDNITQKNNDITLFKRQDGVPKVSFLRRHACVSLVTFVAAVKDVGESARALEVEKRSNRQDQEQADQQRSQKKRGCHTWPSCSDTADQTGNTGWGVWVAAVDVNLFVVISMPWLWGVWLGSNRNHN